MSVKFPDFVSDPAQCRAAEAHWRQRFADLACRPMEQGWTEWGTTTYLTENGGSIYAAKDDAARRGITIVQCVTIANAMQMSAWTGWWGGDASDSDSIGYIKINLVHTDETEKIAIDLLTRFVCERKSLPEMDALIHELGLDQ